MATSNDLISDGLIRHQIRLIRFGGGLRNEVIRILDGTENDIRAQIQRRLETLAGGRVNFSVRTMQRLQNIKDAIQDIQKPAFQDIRGTFRTQLLDLATSEATFVSGIVESTLPVVVNLKLPTSTELRSIVTSRPFEGNVLSRWMQQYERQDLDRIMGAIRIGLVQGESSGQIGRRVFGTAQLQGTNGVRELTRRGAQAISQTAVTAISNEAKQAVYLANAALIPEEMFVATLDSRTTPICRATDGKRFKVGQGLTPPLHINCRSVRVPVINGRVLGSRPAVSATQKQLQGLSGEARRRKVQELVGQVPASTTYQEFLSRQTVAFQQEVLGVQKAALFRKGGLQLDRFVDIRGKELTLSQLRRLEPTAFERAGIA